MQQLEGFQYVIALDLNMEYFTIRISPASQEVITIVIKFGKLIYNCLPMLMCALGDIFQAKVEELLGDIKSVTMYINDILVLSKDCFRNHIEQLIGRHLGTIH